MDHSSERELKTLFPDILYGNGDRVFLTFRSVATVEILLVLISELGNNCMPKQSLMSESVSTVKFLSPDIHSEISDSLFLISLAKAFCESFFASSASAILTAISILSRVRRFSSSVIEDMIFVKEADGFLLLVLIYLVLKICCSNCPVFRNL